MTNRFGIRLFALLALVALAARPAGAQITVLDFDEFACTGATTQFGFALSPYISQGYQLSVSFGSGFASPCSGVAGVARSGALYNSAVPSFTTLTKVGGGAFDLASIDLADYYDFLSASSLTFTGTTPGGGSVFQTVDIPGSQVTQTWSTYVFGSAFDNVTSVAWRMEYPYNEFDNITIGNDVVPEPATMTLLATGIAGMAAARRRRKKA